MLIFYIGKCRAIIHFSSWVLLAFCCIYTGVGGGAGCFMAVLLHEAAHLAVMRGLGAEISEVQLSALGCRIVSCQGDSLSNLGRAGVSLAGPLINWGIYLLAAFLGLRDTPFAFANLALGMVHSLPIEPLDGGLALRYCLRGKVGPVQAERICKIVSVVFLFPLAVIGFLVLLQTKYNYSLLAMSLYLMLYLVLGWDYSEP